MITVNWSKVDKDILDLILRTFIVDEIYNSVVEIDLNVSFYSMDIRMVMAVNV